MDGGGSMQSNEERRAEKLMDDYLKSVGLHRKKIAKDGSCLFRAVAEQVLHCQSLHTKVRAQCVEFLKKNRELYEAFIEGDFEDYLCKLQDPQHWVGEVEINALAVMYKRDFLIYQEPGKPAINITDNNFKDKVQLCFLNGNHYDSVYPIGHIKNAALCQSLLYELLYDGVFKVDRSHLGLCQRVGRPTDLLSDDSMTVCGSSDESDPDAGEGLWVENETTTATRHNRGRGRRGPNLPERVRRSLNPTLFRNIEYDVWHKTKRAQQRMDYCIAAGMQFTVGDRCQVRLEGGGRSYSATIKEVPPNNGPVTVYIEELGRKQVPLWSLRPPGNESSWSTVVSKRLSNGHGEWEERGRGRGRGKHVPAPTSVSQATAPGSSGRVQKQHSWPPQATVEEQGGVKATRKSVSSVESVFGVTEKQRLAKEEEERNVALVEIQLRDEHSFPALGTQPALQGDGGRKKGGEKKRSQRNKTKSPVEDVRAASPSDGEKIKSSMAPLSDTADAIATTKNIAIAANPTLPPAKPPAAPSANCDSIPAGLNTATAAATTVNPPPSCAAPTSKTNTPSYALATAVTPSSPPAAAAALSTTRSGLGGAVPPTVPSSAALFSFLTPVLPAAASPATHNALSSSSPPPSSSSSLPSKSSASPPPPSSLPPPTFIAPIAPSPAAAQGFLPPSSHLRCSPPVPSRPYSPSTHSSSSCSSAESASSLIHHAAHVDEAPTVSAQTLNIEATPAASQNVQSQTSFSHIDPEVPQPQNQNQTQASLTQGEKLTQPPNQSSMPQMQTEAQASLPQSCLPHIQNQPQSHTEVASLPQTQIHPSVPSGQASVSHLQAQNLSQSQPEVVQVQASHTASEASHPHTSQASVAVTVSVQPQPSVTHPQLHVQSAQPPHPSQVTHPSPSLSVSQTYPSLHAQTSNTQNQTEATHPPTQLQPDSPAHAPFQPSHSPHVAHHAHLPSVHPPPPPPPQSIPGAVPLQQLSQLYQDPLYPGFPQGEKGNMAPTPPYSSRKSGDDLPQDINILRFFFNLGIKAYSMPMFAPYIYLLPLQHAHTMHPKVPSRSPSPTLHYPSSNHPTKHQEAYPHPQYPPTSTPLPPQYDQAPLAEPSQHSVPFNQAGYPITELLPHQMSCPSLPWQQHQIPLSNNSSFPVGYPTPRPPYPVPQHLSQGYHPGQGSGLPLYPSSVPAYPPSSLGYPSPSTHEELQVNQVAVEECQSANGDTPSQVHGVLAANNNRTMVVPGFVVKKEPVECLARTLRLGDLSLHAKPLIVSKSGGNDVPVSMTTMKTSGAPGSPLPYDIISKTAVTGEHNSSRGYRGQQKLGKPTNTFATLGAPEPAQVSCLPTTAEPMSVGCNTEDDWEEEMELKATALSHRGPRRNFRGAGRWRGSHDPGRGPNRRRHGDTGPGIGYSQYPSSYRGRGRERGY